MYIRRRKKKKKNRPRNFEIESYKTRRGNHISKNVGSGGLGKGKKEKNRQGREDTRKSHWICAQFTTLQPEDRLNFIQNKSVLYRPVVFARPTAVPEYIDKKLEGRKTPMRKKPM
jgi:hypothetical protein